MKCFASAMRLERTRGREEDARWKNKGILDTGGSCVGLNVLGRLKAALKNVDFRVHGKQSCDAR